MTNTNTQTEEQRLLEDLRGITGVDQSGDEEIVEAGEEQTEADGDAVVNEIVEPETGDEAEAIFSEDELEELDDLDLGEAETEEDATVETVDEDALEALDAAVERQEAYAEQTSVNVVSNATPSAQPAKAAKAKATGPRVERDLSAIGPEFFVLEGDPAAMDQAALDQAKADTVALRPSQVKVAEKFDNLFISVAAGKQPSRYTEMAFALLDQNKTVSSGDIVAAYKAAGLGEGTARSQQGQMMALFDVVGIAKRNGKTLELSEASTLVERLRKISA